jgi:hypothetical protein
MSTKTATIGAWLPSHAEVKPAHANEADDTLLANQCGYASHDMSASGWIRIGDATITIELLPTLELTRQNIKLLRKEQAELHAKSVQIETQIQQLLAIEHTEGA